MILVIILILVKQSRNVFTLSSCFYYCNYVNVIQNLSHLIILLPRIRQRFNRRTVRGVCGLFINKNNKGLLFMYSRDR